MQNKLFGSVQTRPQRIYLRSSSIYFKNPLYVLEQIFLLKIMQAVIIGMKLCTSNLFFAIKKNKLKVNWNV